MHLEPKYIVFRSKLLVLFRRCMSCASLAEGKVDRTVGTMVVVEQTCTNCTSVSKWESQPCVRDTPAGNILLSTAILTSGASVRKVLRVLNQFRLACTTDNTYFNHQRYYIQPAIVKVYVSSWMFMHQNKEKCRFNLNNINEIKSIIFLSTWYDIQITLI